MCVVLAAIALTACESPVPAPCQVQSGHFIIEDSADWKDLVAGAARPSMERLSFPALTRADQVTVETNDDLHELALPSLSSVFYLMVADNPALPECQPLAVKDRLLASGGVQGWFIQGNDAAAICPP